MFGIFVHYSTRPIYDVSMNLFCWPPSVDIFNILPGFLWQPLLIRVQFVELTVEELFAESIDVWVLRENTPSTSLNFIDRIRNLLSRKARHQVRIYLLFRICIWIVLFSGRTFIWREFVVICRIWNFVAFIGIVSTSTSDILTEIGLIHVWICCSFSCLGTF